MQITKTNRLLLPIFTSIFLLNGCSSHQNDIITTIPIEGEQIVMLENETNHIVDDPSFILEDPSWTTELVLDPDAFTAEEYVEKPPVITYKYKFDKKFYDTPRWRSANE